MAKHSARILELARKGAEARFRELMDEAKVLVQSFPHPGELSSDNRPFEHEWQADTGLRYDPVVQENDTVLWRLLSRSGRVTECVVRFAAGGVEVEIRSDGSPIAARIFTTGTEATAWAEEEREAWDRQSD